MSESDLDLFTATCAHEESAPSRRTPVRSLLGFVGVSVGFATVLGLCVGATAALWVLLFGRGILLSVGPWLAWIGSTAAGVHG